MRSALRKKRANKIAADRKCADVFLFAFYTVSVKAFPFQRHFDRALVVLRALNVSTVPHNRFLDLAVN